MLNFLKNFFLNLKQKQYQDSLVFPSDNLPLFPYVDENTLAEHPLIDEYNLARVYSLNNYLNHKIYHSNRHKSLEKYYQNMESLHWIALVSDIGWPFGNKNKPALLLEKVFAVDSDNNCKLLERHVWLNTKYIKHTITNPQSIAVGDAIKGVSNIGIYFGPKKEVKYELRETVILGAGIFVGPDERNDQKTDISHKFITDYDRHNDWILKINNKKNDTFFSKSPTTHELTSLLALSGTAFTNYQRSKHQSYIERSLAHKSIKKRKQKAKSPNFTREVKNIKHSVHQTLNHTRSLQRYHAQFSRYFYYNDQNGNFVPCVKFVDIFNELNESVSQNAFFKINPPLIKLGRLKPGMKISFSTRAKLPNQSEDKDQIIEISTNSPTKLSPIPDTNDALVGMIMRDRNDQTPDHLIFLEKYKEWCQTNNQPLTQNINPAKVKSFNKEEISQQLNLTGLQLEKIIQKLQLKPAYTNANEEYFNENSIKQIEKELHLRQMLRNIRRNKVMTRESFIDKSQITKASKINHTILMTSYGQYYTEELDIYTARDIKNMITEAKNIPLNFYLKVRDVDNNRLNYIKAKNIKEFRLFNSSETHHIK